MLKIFTWVSLIGIIWSCKRREKITSISVFDVHPNLTESSDVGDRVVTVPVEGRGDASEIKTNASTIKDELKITPNPKLKKSMVPTTTWTTNEIYFY